MMMAPHRYSTIQFKSSSKLLHVINATAKPKEPLSPATHFIHSLGGLAADTILAQQFLQEGTIDLQFQHATLPETLKLLHYMRPLPYKIPAIDTHISSDDYRKFLKKWNESTSTSDKRRLGHWKALVSDLPKVDPNKAKADHIINLLVTQLS